MPIRSSNYVVWISWCPRCSFQKFKIFRFVDEELQNQINYLMIYTCPVKHAQLSLCDVQQLDVYINPVNVDNSRDLSSVKTHATNGLSTLWWICRQEPLPWITWAIKVTTSRWSSSALSPMYKTSIRTKRELSSYKSEWNVKICDKLWFHRL